MLQLKRGVNILFELGGITSHREAHQLFESRLDKENLKKLNQIEHDIALLKIANSIALTNPDFVFVNTGSPEDVQRIREMCLESGTEQPLAIDGHTIHYDLPEEQARIVDRTYYIVNEGADVSIMANKILREDACKYIKEHMTGIAEGKTLFIGFYSRGPIGAQAALPALQMSTSPYVMHSGDILYRNVFEKFDDEVARAGYVIANLLSEGQNRPEDLPNARVFMDRSWQITFSMHCTYAGNTLLLKKGNHRFAVDLATYYKKGAELSEHMFITGLTGPGGRKTYFAGAAPSGCGKTTTAMVGTDFIGDDLAQLWIAKDGSLRAINPECGIFGIVQDVNREGDPYLMKALREPGAEVIFSNVLVDENRKPRWVGDGEEPPTKGVNFQGEWWEGKTDAGGKPIPMSHPNARCTLSCDVIGNYNKAAAENPEGVEVRVITYSGRDSDTMPPIVVAESPDHGVVIGASILSKATATEVGVSGVRRQPWANQPFIPGSLAEYMDAQFMFFHSYKLRRKPVIAGLNYFLTEGARGGEGDKLLGEKRDVRVWMSWLERRAHGDVEAIRTPIGFIPKYEDLKALFDEIGKPYPKDLYDRHFSLYIDNILGRIALQTEAYRKEHNVPWRLFEIYDEQKLELEALREKYGPIVSVEQLTATVETAPA
ncbi:MAG: phosphoenolpyruvate carboxykinase (GTP) [Acidobacteriota bacterium]|nr:MAG: phosphoenolpyruvate carboxykinase (GTP) [Acidobacteriota bacterium]